ncbi:MAG: hypothetical protein A2428_10775 [Bdellovibrionales bacterium RIFOXYC1_FULL_54_43]|nr:MAG: hypothetical protein A2428_10775 [Bdellovibrionales bacterium RIFOXYC1_FULL_54_43]OFZ78359.1 MAG: hypothetical protein A2603_12540 [Bdellovibrionales bacterium RIFOXYD1_FULL_55_31]
MAEIRIGISGWTYPPWRGTFYPKGLPQNRELAFASRQVSSIEINGSFYSLQRPSSYQSWYAAAPDDFVFSVKANRYITHIRRLLEIERPLANFFASGVLALREKLGPILWQFPPSFKFDPQRFKNFLEILPRSTHEAARLAKRHDAWMAGRTWVETDEDRPVSHTIEIRNQSFETNEFVAMMRAHEIPIVFSDSGGKWPYIEEVTGGFVYVRLHGSEELYASGYDDAALDDWEDRVRVWKSGRTRKSTSLAQAKVPRKARDVFVYFDNDAKIRAPFDAISLLERLTDFRPAYPINAEFRYSDRYKRAA